jgi:hypothetical protein
VAWQGERREGRKMMIGISGRRGRGRERESVYYEVEVVDG